VSPGQVRRECAAGNGIQQGKIPNAAAGKLIRPGSADRHSAEEPVPPSEVTGVNGAAAAHRLMERTVTLLKWALIFFLVSIVAGVLGFTGISAASADVARFLFYVFVVIFLVLLILGLTIFRV
jgi:uncharacterized membrane protein YtjA (UPF0391 family)